MTAPDLTGLVPLKWKAWVGLIGAALSFAVPYLVEAQKLLPSPWPVVIGVALFIASGFGVHATPYIPKGAVLATAPAAGAPGSICPPRSGAGEIRGSADIMPLRLNDHNETVRTWRAIMNARFGGLYTRLHGPLPTDTDVFGPRAVAWQKEYEARTGQVQDGVVSDNDLHALGIAIPPLPSSGQVCVGITIGGAGSAWNNGYQWDLGEALDKRRCYHQPIGFNTNPFPMQTGVNDGVNEVVRQLNMPRVEFGGRNCTTIPWFVPLAYSMGSIAWMKVLMRVLFRDLQQFKPTFMGSNSFGPPSREKDHGLPGGILVEGEGIAWTPEVHDVPDCHWDFTCEAGMVGSPGNDLYGKVDGSAATVADERAVWNIVNTGNPLSLAEAVLMLLTHPSFNGGYSAAVAAFQALDFFIVKRLTPHTSYGIVQPIAGDNRDCWRIALDRSNDIVAHLPHPFS